MCPKKTGLWTRDRTCTLLPTLAPTPKEGHADKARPSYRKARTLAGIILPVTRGS